MGSKDSDQSLPEVGEAPLIIDVEFLEEDDETLAQPLDSIAVSYTHLTLPTNREV